MAKRRFLKTSLAAVALGAAALAGPAAQANVTAQDDQRTTVAAPEAHGVTAVEIDRAKPSSALLQPPPGGWDVPSDRSYHLEPSCEPYAGAIAQGASAWAGLNETASSGTPVECRNSYITDCGGGGRIVGCNWGRGQRIALYMGGVGDDALLAAHEFGHDWYGHSSYQCAGWSSPAHVMAPSICSYKQGIMMEQRID